MGTLRARVIMAATCSACSTSATILLAFYSSFVFFIAYPVAGPYHVFYDIDPAGLGRIKVLIQGKDVGQPKLWGLEGNEP